MDLAKYGPWALVIGGSEGVGAEFSRMLAARGFDLVIVARKQEPLDALAGELRANGRQVRVLSVDLSKPDAVARTRTVTDDIEIGLLVYNAGANSVRGNFVDLPEETTQAIIALNALGHANFARHYGKLMADRGRGGMILTGSTGGYLGSPNVASYCAAKAFCRIFAEGLWAEMQPRGVDVVHLNIGFTATPAMVRLGIDTSLAEDPSVVAQEGLDNIANGPVWIVSTGGNPERVKLLEPQFNRGELVKLYAIPPRDAMGATQAAQNAATAG